MRATAITIAAILSSTASLVAEEAVLNRSAVWSDTVKRGPMFRQVRGLGVITGARSAELKIAEPASREVRPGQRVSIDTTHGLFRGKVVRVEHVNAAGTIPVKLEFAATPLAVPGTRIDGTIDIERLPDVVYVGRPVFGQANADTALFKLDADGTHATRVKVRFGRISVNTVEIREGLAVGDRVILSDMRAYEKFDRLLLR